MLIYGLDKKLGSKYMDKQIKTINKFKFYDSITLLSPTGQKAGNLKEFLHILEESEEKVIFHHLYQSHLKSFQKMGEFPNDFANWAAYGLEDIALAEKLANFNPYDFNKSIRGKGKDNRDNRGTYVGPSYYTMGKTRFRILFLKCYYHSYFPLDIEVSAL